MEKENFDLRKRLIQFDEVIKMTQNLNSELQKKNENLEIENRTLEEEYHTLKDNYDNLKKRFETLQKEISEIRNNGKKTSMFGWIMNSGQKEEIDNLKDKIITLETELNLKIEENEQIHIEIFEEKQNFNKLISKLESEVEKMKLMLNDKISAITSLNDKNLFLINTQKSLEQNLSTISENLKITQNELELKSHKWNSKKESMKKEILAKKTMFKNLLNINDFNRSEINYLNEEYFNSFSFTNDYSNKLNKISTNIFKDLTQIFNLFESVVSTLIERFNYIYTNIDLKTEHRGYLFACDKLRFHSFTLSQLFKTASVLFKVLKKKYENINQDNSYLNIFLNINIIITILNKSDISLSLIFKYYKILLKEERKISYNEVIDLSIKQQINKDLKNSFLNFTSLISLITKKLNLICNFNRVYNFKNIQIISDNTSGLTIKINPNYFKNYENSTITKLQHKLKLLNSLKEDILGLKNSLPVFVKHFQLKCDIEYKIFEVIKEENKNKYNYPLINLTVLKSNNENLKNYFNELCELLLKTSNQYLIESDVTNLMKLSSWEYEWGLFLPYVYFSSKLTKILICKRTIGDEYLSQEEGVDFEVAMRNKAMLQEMIEKENLLSRDRDNYLNKLTEYEEELKRYEEKICEQQNQNDLLKMQIAKGVNKEPDNSVNLLNEDVENNLSTNEFEEFLKNQINLNDLKYDVLSEDVQSGKQRSSYKLSEPISDRAIPLTKFTSQIEKDQDVSVLYHRKIIEKLQRYASKVRSFDVKVMSSIQTEELNKEYEAKLADAQQKFQEQIDYLTLQLEQKENNIIGYTSTIEFLSEAHTILEQLKDNIKNCNKCKSFLASV